MMNVDNHLEETSIVGLVHQSQGGKNDENIFDKEVTVTEQSFSAEHTENKGNFDISNMNHGN